jgi:hypothetical protein
MFYSEDDGDHEKEETMKLIECGVRTLKVEMDKY